MNDTGNKRKLFHDLRSKMFVVESYFDVAERFSDGRDEIVQLRKSAALCLRDAKSLVEEIAKENKSELNANEKL